MSAKNLQQTNTHVSKLKGATEGRTSEPQNSGPAGLKGGEVYYNTSNNRSYTNTKTSQIANQWKYANYTTTSTTTS
jgi:hypothetical protein